MHVCACVYITYYLSSSVNRDLGCSHILAIMNNGAVCREGNPCALGGIKIGTATMQKWL